mmetsp:Transcript_56583/g.127951  ORF Transcript_56583/g.127951 Transcript_56583/m.127951 type:complete len:112 (+) Transcript_56583:72-407(+)
MVFLTEPHMRAAQRGGAVTGLKTTVGSRDAKPSVMTSLPGCGGTLLWLPAGNVVAQRFGPTQVNAHFGFGHFPAWHFQEHLGCAQEFSQSSPHSVVQIGGLQTVLHLAQSE